MDKDLNTVLIHGMEGIGCIKHVEKGCIYCQLDLDAIMLNDWYIEFSFFTMSKRLLEEENGLIKGWVLFMMQSKMDGFLRTWSQM